MVRIGATDYFIAAQENLEAAMTCHNQGHFVTSHYLCGLVVECLLRAFRWKSRAEFDGRHNLVALFQASDFQDELNESTASTTYASFELIATRWNNNHRFAGSRSLLKFLNEQQVAKNVKGDKLKFHSQEMCEAASSVLAIGVLRWKN